MITNQYNNLNMEEHNLQKKYSKISPALKCYFLHSLYYKCMTIKDAASRCKLNYSTAKVIIRDLSARERKYVKKIIKIKENQSKKGENGLLRECSYRDIIEKEEMPKQQSETFNTTNAKHHQYVEVISRTSFDFFSQNQKGLEQ